MDALTKAREVLSSRLKDKKIMFVPGLAEDLRAIDNAFAEIDVRTRVLASIILRRHYWPESSIKPPHFEKLVALAEPTTKHATNCLCRDCFPLSQG